MVRSFEAFFAQEAILGQESYITHVGLGLPGKIKGEIKANYFGEQVYMQKLKEVRSINQTLLSIDRLVPKERSTKDEYRTKAFLLLHQLRKNPNQRRALLLAIRRDDPELYAAVEHIDSLRPPELKITPDRFAPMKKAA